MLALVISKDAGKGRRTARAWMFLMTAVLFVSGCDSNPPTSPANQAPIARFTWTSTVGETIVYEFDASQSSDPDADWGVASYEWSFGDGESASGKIVTHTYASGGQKSVTLTVTDRKGATDTVTHPVTIENAWRVGDTRKIAQLTGPGSINRTASRWNVHGTDLGHMFLHEEAIYMVFGDTFGKRTGNGRDHRSNVMAVIRDADPTDGLAFDAMITDRPGHARELIGAEDLSNQKKTVIPTSGVSVNGRMFLHYMALDHWGSAGEWELNRSGIAYSGDDGQTWKISDVTWPGDSNFGQVAFIKKGSYVYLFGIPGGRFGSAKLARVDKNHILDRNYYQYWNGNSWTGARTDATTIIPASVGELSVRWNSYYRKWILMTKRQERRGDGYGIVLRTANCLTGSWSDERWVLTDDEGSGRYAPYMPPKWNDGSTIYFALSRFRPVYNVFWWHTSLNGMSTGEGATKCIVK